MRSPGELFPAIMGRLGKELSCYEALKDLTLKQREAMGRNDTDLLIGLLGRKQRYLSLVEGLRKELADFSAEWNTFTPASRDGYRKEIDGMTARIAELLKQTIELEKENMDTFDAGIKRVAKALRQVRTGASAIEQYSILRDTGPGLLNRMT